MEAPKDFFQKTVPATEFGFIEKKPFALRANPLIDKNHPDFLRMEEYFLRLLRQTRFTIEEILQNTFEPHEIRLFEPITGPLELTQLQNDNTLRFLRLLKTRFEGRTSTLQLKMAFLYFGLPVAPMRPGGSQAPELLDLDFGQNAVMFRADPLEFLDDYTERSYGDSSKRVTSTHFFRNPPTKVFSSLKLRGGSQVATETIPPGTDDGDGGEGNAEEEEAYLEGLKIAGFQGVITTTRSYDSFVEATDRLLGSRSGHNYKIRLQIWKVSEGEHHVVDETVGTVFHDKNPAEGQTYDDASDPDFVEKIKDPVLRVLARWFRDEKGLDAHVCFVEYDLEDKPDAVTPYFGPDDGLIPLTDQVNRQAVYMRIPPNLQPTHKSNQFVPQYLKAMQSLFPDKPHQYIEFKGYGITYGMLDPPPAVWDSILVTPAEGGVAGQTNLSPVEIPPDYVPVLVPGFNEYSTDFSSGSAFTKDDLKIRKPEEDRASIAKLTDVVFKAHPLLRGRADISIEVWVPGQDFTNTRISGERISLQDGDLGTPPADWRLLVHNFRRLRLHANQNKLSIVVRPVYDFYQIHARDQPNYQFALDINKVTLAEFKKQLQDNLFQEYQEGQVLYLSQTTWGENRNEFVITANTDEEGWKFITRRITEQNITVSVEDWTSDQEVNEDTTWGPRYHVGDLDELTSLFENPSQPKETPLPYGDRMNTLFKNSGNDLGGAERAARLRDRFFYSDPSIFANPAKPAIPLHAPPIETIISTGPNVPAFTTAMRTPTEVARLEKEVHTLRGNLLARIKECPYMECKRYFTFADGEGLARHLREDHKVFQCFLCTPEKDQTTLLNSDSVRRHFLLKHYDDLKEFFGAPARSGVKIKYCSRCGRDESKLNNPADIEHHEKQCKQTTEEVQTTWCPCCGEQRVPKSSHCPCGMYYSTTYSSDKQGYCEKCGMQYDGSMSQAYRKQHSRLCRPVGGLTDDYCAKCGVNLASLTVPAKDKHIRACNKVPDGGDPVGTAFGHSARAVAGPSSEGELDADEILELLGGSGSRSKRRGDRQTRKKNRKSKKAEKKAKKAAALDPVPRRRKDSPDWDESMLGDASEPYKFMPEPHWRCSRCFRCAGVDVEEIELHMDEFGSCKIRRGLGTTKGAPMPNRSGWIATPEVEDYDFPKAYFKFVKKYPAYRFTMFPTHQKNVKKVWESPYDVNAAIGSIKDDPNYTGKGASIDAVQSIRLPWPPYQGKDIPAEEQEEFEEGLSDFDIQEEAGLEWDVAEEEEEEEEEEEAESEPEQLDSSSEVSPIITPVSEWDPEVPTETKEGRHKRKRHEQYDPSFESDDGTTTADSELEEEYSEAGAVPDPVANLDPDAPPTPKGRPGKKAKKTGGRPSSIATTSSSLYNRPSIGGASSRLSKYMHAPPTAVTTTPRMRPSSAGISSTATATATTPTTATTGGGGGSTTAPRAATFFPPHNAPSGSFGPISPSSSRNVFGTGRAGSLPPPSSARSHFTVSSLRSSDGRPSTSQSITTSTSWWPRPGSSRSGAPSTPSFKGQAGQKGSR